MSIKICELTPENAKLLNNIAPDVFDNPINSKYLSQFLKDPRHTMYLAVDGELVIGMVSSVEYYHPDKAPQMWINEVGVAKPHRKQKIGRRLVATVINAAEEKGSIYCWLGTDQKNKAAQACFNAVPAGEKPQAFLLYEWDLED